MKHFTLREFGTYNMDLLGGYGSSDDDDDEKEHVTQKRSEGSSLESNEKGVKGNDQQQLRKGRKILSLAAVLPQHILDQLEKSQFRGDEDDDDDSIDAAKPVPKKKLSATRCFSADAGIASLLSDLGSASTSSERGKKEDAERIEKGSPEKLGEAFVTSTTTTFVRPSKQVRHIHNDSSFCVARPPSRNVAREENSEEEFAFSTFPATSPPIVEKHEAPASASGMANVFVQDEDFPQRNGRPAMSRKRTHREMQKALMKGDFAAALQGQDVAKVQQAHPDAYHPEPETYAVPQHGIKVVPTAIYDPSSGAASTKVAGKGRGKNQIHHLMASAANLELQRARGMGGNSSESGKAHRIKARNKYGW